MSNTIITIISKELQIPFNNVNNVINLFNDKATVPFIARYRKEMTGSLDEVAILKIKDKFQKLTELEKRKESILSSIEEQGKLTEELKVLIANTFDSSELEDIYLPYKQKRKTKATIAKEKGLEPLAKMIIKEFDNIEQEIRKFISKDVSNEDEAINGAKDIVAEWINENVYVRKRIRSLYENEAKISTKVIKGKEEEGNNFKDYFEYSELLRKCPSHRFLAIKRGHSEGFINYKIQPEENKALFEIERIVIKKNNTATDYLQDAIKDSYKRLIHPSVENEIDSKFKELSDIEAIKVFAENIRQLLLSPPLGKKRVLAIDPGFRTGCKVVCLDETGKLLHNETIYPHPPQEDVKQASKKIASMIDAYKIDAISIGNGTAGRETEYFIKKLKFNKDIKVFVVSEAGASIYSASAIAREEFPQYDVTVRGAVSIGRRLMDPLAELVKIDPESIGVGQYQHDVDHKLLKESLDNVVESCVNQVGVNLNTASKHLLQYVSGLGPQIAQNIIDYRNENGEFKSRKELQKINRLGSKAFEQCAGFLRIPDAKNPLDNSAVHPESYQIVETIAKDLKCKVEQLIRNEELLNKIPLENYVTESIGLPTLNDIKAELLKPGLDPRYAIKTFEFAPGIYKIDNLELDMVLPGIVTNITNFGAFVDIGIKQTGLVHISQLADEFVRNPADYVKLHQHVTVKVIEIDKARNRIQLTMKGLN